MMWLTIENMGVTLGNKVIIKALDLHLAEGEIACLLGASGCGKTTVLRCIAGFEHINGGSITLHQRLLANAHHHLPAHERQVGMVFQDYALFPHLNIAANIAFGLHQCSRRERQARVNELLELVELSDFAHVYPHQLSGGQQQRVALARALAPKPKLLLLDEPFSNLDAELRNQLASDVRSLLKKEGITAILVTHDQQEAFSFADKIGLLADGQLQQWGSPHELFYRPLNPVVADFFGEGRWLDAQVTDEYTLRTVLGTYQHHQPHQLAAGEVKLLVRPNEVMLTQGEHNATVEQAVFLGSHVQHVLKLDNQEELIASWAKHAEGEQAVALKLINVIAFHPN